MVADSINDNFDSVFKSLNGDGKRKAEGDAGDGVSKKLKGEESGDREELAYTRPCQLRC
mgnify:CR=1 FL=1